MIRWAVSQSATLLWREGLEFTTVRLRRINERVVESTRSSRDGTITLNIYENFPKPC